MENLSNLQLGLIFNNIFYLINHKKAVSTKTSEIYLQTAVRFLESVIKSLDSLSSVALGDNANSYSFIPNLKEMLNLSYSDKQRIEKDDVEKYKKYFESLKNKYQLLRENPASFYSDSSYKSLGDISAKIATIYAGYNEAIEEEVNKEFSIA